MTLYTAYFGKIDKPGIDRYITETTRALKERMADCLWLSIASNGGSVCEAKRLYSFLREHHLPLVTESVGHVYSAAGIPYLAGDHRVADPFSHFLIHDVRKLVTEPQEIRLGGAVDIVQLLAKDRQSISDLYTHRTGFSATEMTSFFNSDDFYFGPDVALAKGVSHQIARIAKPIAAVTIHNF